MSWKRLILTSLAQASSTTLFCGLAVGAVAMLQKYEAGSDSYLDTVALLLLFVTSALISATLVLGYPSYLILQQRFKEGFWLLFSTVGWLVIILGGILAVIVVRGV